MSVIIETSLSERVTGKVNRISKRIVRIGIENRIFWFLEWLRLEYTVVSKNAMKWGGVSQVRVQEHNVGGNR